MRKVLIYMLMVSLCLMVAGVATAQEVQEKTLPEEGVILPPEAVDIPDDTEEEAGVPVPCGTVPGNLVTNCGFETGNFSGWTRTGDPSFTGVQGGVVAFTGNFGAFFGPVDDLGFIAQNLTTTPGQTYTLTFPLRNNGGPNRLQVSWNGQVIFDSAVGNFNYHRPQSGWTGLVATGTSTELKLGFYNVPDFYYLDDVVVIAQ